MKKILIILTAGIVLIAVTGCKNEPGLREPVISIVVASTNTLQLPDETSVTLSASATSADGSAVKSYQWKVAAPPALPAGAQIVDADKATATVTGLNVAGT